MTRTATAFDALTDALQDIAQDAEDRAEVVLDALHRLAEEPPRPRRNQAAEHARMVESAWDRAFAEGWGWDVLRDL